MQAPFNSSDATGKFEINGHHYYSFKKIEFTSANSGMKRLRCAYIYDAVGKLIAVTRSKANYETAFKSAKRKVELYACELVGSPTQSISDEKMIAAASRSTTPTDFKHLATAAPLTPAQHISTKKARENEAAFLASFDDAAPVTQINKKRKYYTIDASTANIKTEIKTEFVEERQTIEEAYKVLAAAVEGFQEKGYKFPSFDLGQVSATHKNGFAFNIQSDWREHDETFVMLGTFCVYPGIKDE